MPIYRVLKRPPVWRRSNILPDLQETLDRLEPIILETQKASSLSSIFCFIAKIVVILQKLAPQRPFRKSLLGELPRPTPRPECIESIPIPPSDKQVQATVPPPRPSADPVAHVAEDLLLGPSEQTATPSHSLPPSSPALEERQPPTEKQSSGDNSTSRFLSTSLKTQEELSAQLADMAKQLKINSLHFTEALARDRIVIEGAEGKLQGNLTRIQTERGRLKLHSLKSGSTTWIVMAAIITVIVAWIVMFLIIRIT